MTITLAPQTEAKLKEMATREGRDENMLAEALLSEVLEAANRDHSEMLEGIERGRQAYTEGRSRPFSQYVSEILRRRQDLEALHTQEPEKIAA